jgi:hypothetical protein
MLAIDYFLRALVAVAAVGLLVLPGSVSWKLMCLASFSVGLWCVLFPPGIMGWAKVAHPAVDASDKSLWWIPRLIGSAFIAAAFVFTVIFFK